MEDALFHSLNAGARFNKKRFGQQIDLFKHGNKHQGGAAQQLGFGYAAGGLDGAPADTLDFFNNDKGLEKSNSIDEPSKEKKSICKKKGTRLSNDAGTSHDNRSSIAVWPSHEKKKKKKKSNKKKVSRDKKRHERTGSVDGDSHYEEDVDSVSMYSRTTSESRGWTNNSDMVKKTDGKISSAAVDIGTNEIRYKIELINAFRRRMRIRVKGNAIPDPAETFESIRFNSKKDEHVRKILLDNIEKSHYKEPTPIQMQAIPVMMEGRDIVAVAPTGSGKTAAFLIPLIGRILKRPISNINASMRKNNNDDNNGNSKIATTKALVLTPTRELAVQIFRDFERLSFGKKFKAAALSSVKILSNKMVSNSGMQQSRAPQFDLLIATPLRLLTALNQELLSLKMLKCLILDEADRLFEDGFLQQIDEIINACGTTAEEQKQLQRAMFSATMPEGIEELVKSVLIDPVRVQIGQRGAATDTIEQKLIFVGREEGKLVAMRQLIQEGGMTPPVIIFVQSRERAAALFKELVYDGINVDVIHADRTKKQRDTIIKKFRIGETWVLIATDLMARGMDFKGVNCVINYDFPQSTVSYVHRIGRTGRAGRKGKAITFFTESDMKYLRSIANVMKISGCEDVPEWMLKLKKQNRSERKYMKKYAPKRSRISTTSGFDKKKRNNKRSKHS